MSIENTLKAYEAALNASDTDAVLALYGTTPVFMPQFAPALVGREAVRAGYEQVFAAIRLHVVFTIHEVEQHGDTAWVRTSSAGRTTILADGGAVSEGNNEVFILRDEQGDWKIHRYIFASIARAV